MKYLKINNLMSLGSVCDYKGLDTNKFVPGMQIYPDNENIAYIITTQEEIPVNADLTEITEVDYNTKKPQLQPLMPTVEERLSAVEDLLLTMI